MPITMMGTIGDYTKTMKLQTQWNLKKQSGDLTSHQKSLNDWLQPSDADSPIGDKASHDKMRSIYAKIDAGKKLTAEEREYLKANDPEAYSDLEANEKEQQAYERKLKQCRTKEEVQRLKMAHLGASLAKVKSVENDPAISLEKKLKIAAQEKRRCDKLEESTREFVRRGEYEKLPTDQEKAKAEKEEAERKSPEIENTEKSAQEAEPSAKEDVAADRSPKSEATSETQTRKPEATPKTQTGKPEKSDVQTESPELRKTRRAKAKAAYAHAESPRNTDVSALDVKA